MPLFDITRELVARNIECADQTDAETVRLSRFDEVRQIAVQVSGVSPRKSMLDEISRLSHTLTDDEREGLGAWRHQQGIDWHTATDAELSRCLAKVRALLDARPR